MELHILVLSRARFAKVPKRVALANSSRQFLEEITDGLNLPLSKAVGAANTIVATLTMPKAAKQKRNGAANSSPYTSSKPKSSSNNIFKMNTNIGQHVLKNPGVAQAIVDKADLKQSDV